MVPSSKINSSNRTNRFYLIDYRNCRASLSESRTGFSHFRSVLASSEHYQTLLRQNSDCSYKYNNYRYDNSLTASPIMPVISFILHSVLDIANLTNHLCLSMYDAFGALLLYCVYFCTNQLLENITSCIIWSSVSSIYKSYIADHGDNARYRRTMDSQRRKFIECL